MWVSSPTVDAQRWLRSPRPLRVGARTLWPSPARRWATASQHQPPCQPPCTNKTSVNAVLFVSNRIRRHSVNADLARVRLTASVARLLLQLSNVRRDHRPAYEGW